MELLRLAKDRVVWSNCVQNNNQCLYEDMILIDDVQHTVKHEKNVIAIIITTKCVVFQTNLINEKISYKTI